MMQENENELENQELKDTLIYYLSFWRWILASVFLFFIIGILVYFHFPKQFESYATIDVGSNNKLSDVSLLQDLGLSNGVSDNLSREIAKFKSPDMLKLVIEDLSPRTTMMILSALTLFDKANRLICS